MIQLPATKTIKEEPRPKITCHIPTLPKNMQAKKIAADLFHVPTFSTEDVFSDKTDDMESDYYFPPGIKRSKF